MEPPVVPVRRRLTRDYTSEEDVNPHIRRYREGGTSSGPKGYDVDGTLSSPVRRNYREPEELPQRQQHHEQSILANGQRLDGITSHQRYRDHSSEHRTSPLRRRDDAEDLRKLDFNLNPSHEPINDESSITSNDRSHTTDTPSTAITTSSGSRMPDFFSGEVFQTVLHNPTTSHQLLKFARSRLCAENIEYLSAINRYHALLNDVATSLYDIHKTYLSASAASEVNLPEYLLTKTTRDLKSSLQVTLPKLESVFTPSQDSIENLVGSDIYPRFVRHQMNLSATRALANPATTSPSSRYAGLGDCFVLTDPHKADNPIVFASEGFVKVTGYPRHDIIPRNCRFLQSRHTDRSAVRRLRTAIQKREESVELLLNERKDGEPFWNLLYTAPLFDARGNLVFFLGGQINCSTTIHSQSDVLKILATPEDDPNDVARNGSAATSQQQHNRDTQRSKGGGFFSSFRSRSNVAVQPKATPGMEGQLLGRIEQMDMRGQMGAFYTAYSKYLVINATTMLIAFHSPALLSLLSLPRPTTGTSGGNSGGVGGRGGNDNTQNIPSPIGQDVFRFLAAYSPNGSLPSGYKSRVKSAVKEGRAVSLECSLCVERVRGFERCVGHWTMLMGEEGRGGGLGKGERVLGRGGGGGDGGVGEVAWIVLTLGGG